LALFTHLIAYVQATISKRRASFSFGPQVSENTGYEGRFLLDGWCANDRKRILPGKKGMYWGKKGAARNHWIYLRFGLFHPICAATLDRLLFF